MKTRKRLLAAALSILIASAGAACAEFLSTAPAGQEPAAYQADTFEGKPSAPPAPTADEPGTTLSAAPVQTPAAGTDTPAPATPGPRKTPGLPTPEPASPVSTLRPTPAPTDPPAVKVIDHINDPQTEAGFYFPKGSELLEIWIPNIKDADAFILRYQGQVYMIDCGDENATLRSTLLLRQLEIGSVDILFISHLHHDHIGGLGLTDNMSRIKSLRICFPPDSTESGINMYDVAGARNIPISQYKNGDTFTMGDGEVTLQFFKNDDEDLDMNNQSAITAVRYGECSMLFMADMERDGQTRMFEWIDPSLLKSDILKYPHHGKSVMYEPFYRAVDPALVIVTAPEGRRGDTGQLYLHNKKVSTVYTSVKGMFVRLVTDGKNWLCERVPVTTE